MNSKIETEVRKTHGETTRWKNQYLLLKPDIMSESTDTERGEDWKKDVFIGLNRTIALS